MGSVSTGMRRLAAALTTVLLAIAMLGVHLPSASAASWFDDSKWFRSTPAFNTKLICIYTCQLYTLAMSGIAWQGPEGRETEIPKVGERFYIRVYSAVVFPFNVQDSYQMRVLLPTGVTPDIRSDTDVLCAITDTANNTTRSMPGSECQDPVQNGVYQQFPAVALSQGEVAWFFFPVKATRAMSDETAFGVSSDLISNPQNALPDPLWSSMPISVAPAPVAPAPAPTPGPTTPAPTTPGPTTPAPGGSESGGPGQGGPPPGLGVAPTLTGVKASTRNGRVILVWKKASLPVSRYLVQVKRKGKWVKAGKAAGSAKRFSWSKAKRGKRYVFRIAAVTPSGIGPWSSSVRVKVK